jgi:uncharacterized protein (DUF58 family)
VIAPRSKLLWLTAALVLPSAIIAAVAPRTTLFAAAAVVMLLAIAAIDAILAPGRLRGVRVVLPALVRMSKDRKGTLEIRVERQRNVPKKIRLGLTLPPELVPDQEDITTDLPTENLIARLDWTCTPEQRGSFMVDTCYVGTASQLGLWDVRTSVSTNCEIRVYPNLLAEKKTAASLLLRHGREGVHLQRQVGQGREFEKLREYVHGDGFDEIHWKATARRGKPITKVFQVERTQEVYVVIDCSRLSGRAIGGESILERYLISALLLGIASEQQSDLFGLIAFDDKIQRFVRAKNGKLHYGACRDALYSLKPRLVSPDFGELANFIRVRLRRRALLIFLTELDDPVIAESFERSIRLIARQHLILVNMLKPEGAAPLFTEPAASTDELYERLSGHMCWQTLEETTRRLGRSGMRFHLLNPERPAFDLTEQYRSVKQRQLL